jgi:hypothetical protein
MFRDFAPQLLNAKHGLVVCLSLTAAAGWGSFAVSSQSSTEMERQLRLQVTSLQETQTQLLSERTRTQAALSEMAQLRTDLAAARTEIARLSRPINPAQPELPPVRPEAKGNLRSSETSDEGLRTGSIGAKTTKPQPIKAASGEKPLLQDRQDQPAAVKIKAQDVQKATEAPQRGRIPTITTALDTASLRLLTKAAQAQR